MATYGNRNTDFIKGSIMANGIRTKLVLILPHTFEMPVEEQLEKAGWVTPCLNLIGKSPEDTIMSIEENINTVSYILFDCVEAGIDLLSNHHIPVTVVANDDKTYYAGILFLKEVPKDKIDLIMTNWHILRETNNNFIEINNFTRSFYPMDPILKTAGASSGMTNHEYLKKTAVLCCNKSSSIHNKNILMKKIVLEYGYILYDTSMFAPNKIGKATLGDLYNICLVKEQMIFSSDVVLFATVKRNQEKCEQEDYAAVFDEDAMRELKFAQDNNKEIRFIYY